MSLRSVLAAVVLRDGHRLHVVGIDTQLVAAQVVNRQASWDGANEKLVSIPVRQDSEPLAATSHRAVTRGVRCARPLPAHGAVRFAGAKADHDLSPHIGRECRNVEH